MHTTSRVAVAGMLVGLISSLPRLAPQDPAKPAPEKPAPARAAAKAEDVASIDAILGALYGCISGPVGQARDFARMRSLFADGARLLPTRLRGNGLAVRALSVDDYVNMAGDNLVQVGFREVEITRRVDQFGGIAQVFSTYASYRGDEKEPFARGINSIQLSFDGKRWWVQSILWQDESAAHPIPATFLPAPK